MEELKLKFETFSVAEKVMDEILKEFSGQIENDGKILQMVNGTELVQLYEDIISPFELYYIISISNNYNNRGQEIYDFAVNMLDRDISDLNIYEEIEDGNIIRVATFDDEEILDGQINLIYDTILDKYYNYYNGECEDIEEINSKDLFKVNIEYNKYIKEFLEYTKQFWETKMDNENINYNNQINICENYIEKMSNY